MLGLVECADVNVTSEGSQLECTLPPGVGATISVYLVITLGVLGEIRQETSPQVCWAMLAHPSTALASSPVSAPLWRIMYYNCWIVPMKNPPPLLS